MVPILINIIEHEQFFFSSQAHVSAACSFLSKSRHIMLEWLEFERNEVTAGEENF